MENKKVYGKKLGLTGKEWDLKKSGLKLKK